MEVLGMSVVLDNGVVAKHAGGCPPRFKSAKDMQVVIDQYFRDCKGEMLKDNEGKHVLDKYGCPVVIDSFPPTITGLALALGFTSRQALLNYQDKAEFVDTVTHAKTRVEAYTEARLFDKDGVNGAKFSLTNNFKGWRDTQNIELTGANSGPLLVQDVSALSDGDLERLIEIAEKLQITGEVVDITPINEE